MKLVNNQMVIDMLQSGIFSKKTSKVSDGLDQATSIRRPFIKLYQELKWLNAFAIINEVAVQEVLKDLDSVYFTD